MVGKEFILESGDTRNFRAEQLPRKPFTMREVRSVVVGNFGVHELMAVLREVRHKQESCYLVRRCR